MPPRGALRLREGLEPGGIQQVGADLLCARTTSSPVLCCHLISLPLLLPLLPQQVFDDYLRKRASKLGAKLINGLYMGLETKGDGPITIRYNEYKEGEWCGGAVA